MPDRSSATPPSDQLDRIERKLDEVLAFRDQLLGLLEVFGGRNKLLANVLRKKVGA